MSLDKVEMKYPCSECNGMGTLRAVKKVNGMDCFFSFLCPACLNARPFETFVTGKSPNTITHQRPYWKEEYRKQGYELFQNITR